MAVPQKDIITVEGESILLQCQFKGNYEAISPSLSVYWMIRSRDQHTKPTYIQDNSTDKYQIAVYQTCLSDNGSCCNFTNNLSIQNIPLELNDNDMTCGVVFDDDGTTNSHSHTATIGKQLMNASVIETCQTVLLFLWLMNVTCLLVLFCQLKKFSVNCQLFIQ